MGRPSEVSVVEVSEKIKKKEQFLLLDVRTVDEYQRGHLTASHIPLADLPQRYQELDVQDEIVVYCHHGVRSLHACQFLMERGFEKVLSMSGGIDAWSQQIDPTVERY